MTLSSRALDSGAGQLWHRCGRWKREGGGRHRQGDRQRDGQGLVKPHGVLRRAVPAKV